MLHGNVPGKERRGLLEQFRDDPECRVFLSTDAGGTGLNLQAADTVINLEVPWNPAVLEQRIARVHRMGQHRPVQVFNLVMRDSIEERVLRTLEQKRSLFDGDFQRRRATRWRSARWASRRSWRRCAACSARRRPKEPSPEAGDSRRGRPGPAAEDARLKLVQAGVQLLEALAAVMAESSQGKNGVPPLPPETLQRGTAALQTILRSLGVKPETKPAELSRKGP